MASMREVLVKGWPYVFAVAARDILAGHDYYDYYYYYHYYYY